MDDWVIVAIIVFIVLVILYLLSRPNQIRRPFQNLNLPVVDLDLNQYAGRWYEVARTPNSYQADCIDSQAEYTLLPDSKLRIQNSCTANYRTYKVDGIAVPNRPPISASGRIYPGSFSVKFNGSTEVGQYNVIYVDRSYDYAIVAGGQGELWILSRKEDIPRRTYEELTYIASRFGFDRSKLIVNPYIKFDEENEQDD